MGRRLLISIATGAALLFGAAVHAQQQPSSPPPPPPAYGTPITLEQAKAAIAGAEAESKKNGWNHVFAVVDGAGILIAFEKSDLAGNASVTIAEAKARMAATFQGTNEGISRSSCGGRNLHIGITGCSTSGGRSTHRSRWQTRRCDRRKWRGAVAGSSIRTSWRRGGEVTSQFRRGQS